MFAREGYPFILGAAALAALTFAMALRLRSWPLWLVAIALTVIALWVAWFFRNPTRVGERAANVSVGPADGKFVRSTDADQSLLVKGPTVRRSIVVSVYGVHVDRDTSDRGLQPVQCKARPIHNSVTASSSNDNNRVTSGIVMSTQSTIAGLTMIAGLRTS